MSEVIPDFLGLFSSFMHRLLWGMTFSTLHDPPCWVHNDVEHHLEFQPYVIPVLLVPSYGHTDTEPGPSSFFWWERDGDENLRRGVEERSWGEKRSWGEELRRGEEELRRGVEERGHYIIMRTAINFLGPPNIPKTFSQLLFQKKWKNTTPDTMISSEQLLTYQWKKALHLHCPHRKPLAYSLKLYKHTGHTLKIFWHSSDTTNKIEKNCNQFQEL